MRKSMQGREKSETVKAGGGTEKGRQRGKRSYMQYSKRFAIAALAIGCIAYLTFEMRVGDSPEYQYKAFVGLLEYIFGVVAVYNGNSSSEKYFSSKYHLFNKENESGE